jgi:ParB family transcriptional regulator, chromosome partitioning protein
MSQMIPLDQIIANPNQPRKAFDPEYIDWLARSIERRGLIQPISLRPISNHPPVYMITAGECRWRAHKQLKRARIKADVEAIDAREMRLRAIVENLTRRDVNPMEEANAYQDLLSDGYTVDQIVAELGLKSPSIVRQRLDLLNLTPEIQHLVAAGQLNVSMAWGVAIAAPRYQAQLVRDIASGTLRTTEQVRHAGIALREAEAQLDAFAMAPRASGQDVETISRLERKIEAITAMVALGFQDGECVAAQRVSVERVRVMADKLTLIRKHILRMEHNLRCAATRNEIISRAHSHKERDRCR